MPDSRPLEKRTHIAKSLIADFGKSTTQFKSLNSRYMVSGDLVLNYISQYISLFNDQDELRNAPKLLLHHLHLADTLTLPSGLYPSIEIEQCIFIGGLHLSDATVHGALTFKNLTNANFEDFSATLSKVSIELQFLVKNYVARNISIHACSLQDLVIQPNVQRLRIDCKTSIRGNCNLFGCNDAGISEVEFGGHFTFMSSGDGSEVEIMNCRYSELATFASSGHPIKFIAIHDTEFPKGFRFAPLVSEDAVFRRVKFFFLADFQNTNFHSKTSL